MHCSALAVSTRDINAHTVLVTAAGDIDYGNHRRLRHVTLEAVRRGRVNQVLDITGVSACDSSGLSAFVAIRRRTADRGGDLRLAGPSVRLATLLSIARLDHILPVYETVAAALGDCP
jgi:anti-sigma B factor antagonist